MHAMSLHMSCSFLATSWTQRRKLKAKGLDDCLPVPIHQVREPVSKARGGVDPR